MVFGGYGVRLPFKSYPEPIECTIVAMRCFSSTSTMYTFEIRTKDKDSSTIRVDMEDLVSVVVAVVWRRSF